MKIHSVNTLCVRVYHHPICSKRQSTIFGAKKLGASAGVTQEEGKHKIFLFPLQLAPVTRGFGRYLFPSSTFVSNLFIYEVSAVDCYHRCCEKENHLTAIKADGLAVFRFRGYPLNQGGGGWDEDLHAR